MLPSICLSVRQGTYVRSMRTKAEYLRVVDLASKGLNSSSIARLTDIPRSTIREWRKRSVGGTGAPGSAWRRDATDGGCATCGGVHPAEKLPAAQYVLGIYLGDRCISSGPRDVYRLRIFLDSRYEGIIDRAAVAVKTVMPGRTVGQRWTAGVGRGCVEVYSYSKQWPCLFPQHGPGKKHERCIQLVDWQEKLVALHRRSLLRGLIESDGCRFIARQTSRSGRRYEWPRYVFDNLSGDIRQLFCEQCDALGIRWTVSRPGRTIQIARLESVATMDTFVGPKY